MSTTRRAAIGNLPAETTSFVGRRRELGEIPRLLADGRLVTLTGVGGVGKTRLVLRVAAGLRRAFADGVWLVDLTALPEGGLVCWGVQDPDTLADLVAATLGLPDRGGGRALPSLVERLADRHLLLVLDNCEHQLPASAILVDALLRACPNLRVLTTSREPLAVAGETLFAVPPLPIPDPQRTDLAELARYDAVALFIARAQAIAPGFDLTADNRAAVAELCHRLDGLPLAIELAVAWLRVLAPEQILDRMADRFALLNRGSRMAPERQQMLRACVDWSFELCAKPERVLWERLAVFAGGCELDAVEGICADELLPAEEMLEVVARLVDQSILIRDDQGGRQARYRVLETIRAYGQERLQQAGELAALRRRHRDWYARLALRAEAEWISPRQVYWFARLDREHPNIAAALEFCLTEPGEAEEALRIGAACLTYWVVRGRLSQGRHWLDRALTAAPDPTPDWVNALVAACGLAVNQGDLAAASALVAQGRATAAARGTRTAHALISRSAGHVALFSGDLPRAVADLQAAAEVFRADHDLLRLVETLVPLALAHSTRGDAARATACHQEILALTQAHGEVWYQGYALWSLGVAACQQRETDRAGQLLTESLRLTRAVDSPFANAWCLEALAWTAVASDARRAATLLGAAAGLGRVIGARTPFPPYLAAHHEACERQTRDALGDAAFTDAFRHGAGLGLNDAIAYALDEKRPPAPPAPAATPTPLTRRERQVAGLVAQGLSNKQIATTLVISQRTAESHVEHILTKLGFRTRTAIAAWVAGQRTAEHDS